MNYEATLTPPTPATALSVKSPPARGAWTPQLSAAITAIIVMLGLWAWNVRHAKLYASGSGFGYLLGLLGGALMLALLFYPVRKHIRFMHEWGPLKYWFRFHMVAGILGPVLVLFHSTFRVGSINAGVALSCMLLVVSSGLVGRVLYRKIHHGLYGSHATLQELQQIMAHDLELLAPLLQRLPAVKRETDRFAALVSHQPSGQLRRCAHFLSLGWRRLLAGRRVRRAISNHAPSAGDRPDSSHTDLTALLQKIDITLKAVQRTAQFSTYERLLSLWHVVHIPFLCLLVITAVVHVVAVHIY